jgi:hypothetical protein
MFMFSLCTSFTHLAFMYHLLPLGKMSVVTKHNWPYRNSQLFNEHTKLLRAVNSVVVILSTTQKFK